MAATKTEDASAPPHHRVISRLLIDDIVVLRSPPGTCLREREIAARFDVSHAPVREAFRHLASIGLVKVVPWRGAYAIDVDDHGADEIYELWKALFGVVRSEEHTSELQSLMRSSYAVFGLKKKRTDDDSSM